MKAQRIVILVVGILCAAAVVAAFRLIGSPGYQQRLVADNARIDDLRSIAVAISKAGGASPASPPAQVTPTYSHGYGVLSSAISTAPYPYRRIDARHFELCATFLEPASENARDAAYPHGAGRVCYRFDMQNRDGTPIP